MRLAGSQEASLEKIKPPVFGGFFVCWGSGCIIVRTGSAPVCNLISPT